MFVYLVLNIYKIYVIGIDFQLLLLFTEPHNSQFYLVNYHYELPEGIIDWESILPGTF